MKIVLVLLAILSVSTCLYENSEYVKTLEWSSFKKTVMESDEPWFLNFGSDNCPECKTFAPIWEQAAKTQHGEINYGYIDITKQRGITNFFGIGGQNHQIFLCEEKPQPAGSPSFFSWPKDLKNVLQFGKNELFLKKRQHIFRGTDFTKKLVSKKDLETQVLKSKEPWFLLFCSQQENDCLELIFQFDQAAKQLKGKVGFGLVDTMRSEITDVFGISGTGVCIYLAADKPGPVGSPSLVGSQLKKKDYEKHVWDVIESPITQQAKQLVAEYPQIPEVTYQQIMKHKGASIILFYSGSETFGNDELLKQQLSAFSQTKYEEKIQVGRMSVDDNKWIINHFDIWPVPSIYYLPINTKTAETLELYEGEYTTEALQKWGEEELFDNQNDKQIILTRQNFQQQVMNSEEAWFVQFYTLNNNWCRKCAHLQPEWKKLSNLMNGQVNIAKLNCDIAKDICQTFKVFNFPKLLFFHQGPKEWSIEKNVEYDGAFSKNELAQFAKDQAKVSEIAKIRYLDSAETFHHYCEDLNGICFISVLPRLDAKDAEPRQQYINTIQSINDHFKKESVSFLWSVDQDQPHLQDRFNLCTKGFPCTIGIDHRVDKDQGYKVFSKKFNKDDYVKNIQDLLDEKRGFVPIKKALPEILTATTTIQKDQPANKKEDL